MTPQPPAGPAAGAYEQLVEVETPEQVVISYAVAGVGTRAAAALIDYAICLVPGLLFAALLLPYFRGGDGDPTATGLWVTAVLILAQFAVLWGYYVLFEGLNDGQTPGKARMRLRVVQDGGYGITMPAAAVRNLVRLLDMQPGFFYLIGIVSIAVSRNGKRLGDIVAGTIVVQERVVHPAPAAGVRTGSAPAGVPPARALLDEEEYALLARFQQRAGQLDSVRRAAIAQQLAVRFEGRLSGDPNAVAEELAELFASERTARAAGAAAPSDTGARREQNALVAAGSERWRKFAERVRRIQAGGGLRGMPEEAVSAFAAEYRALAADLARLRTASRGRDEDAVFQLSRLLASGHNLLYGRRRALTGSAWRYLAFGIPREVRRAWRPVSLAAVFLFFPAVIAYMSTMKRPERARDYIPAAMLERAESAVERGRAGGGYIDVPEPFQPVLASSIIANNVQVTYAVFSFGVTAGIGTFALLVFNGMVLGGFAGLYTSTGAGDQLLAFVAPHGVLELSAIVIAGGAGLLLGAAILIPGAITRREALVAQGRRSLALIVCSTLLLIVAGTIEGFISPRIWPLEWKLGVSVISALLLLLYLTRGRQPDPARPVV